VDALHGSTRWLLLQVGWKNAFKSTVRPAILGALKRLCPSMMPSVRQAFLPAPPACCAGGHLVYPGSAAG